MSSMTFFFLFVVILALIFLIVNLILAPHNPYQEKYSIFECGFHSFLGQNRTQFGVKFFIFALVYLLLDLEILLTFPFAVSGYINNIYGLIIALLFIIIITIGFVFELGKSALKIDSRQVVTFFNKKSDNISEYIVKDGMKDKNSKLLDSGLYLLMKRNLNRLIYKINLFVRKLLIIALIVALIVGIIYTRDIIFNNSLFLVTIFFITFISLIRFECARLRYIYVVHKKLMIYKSIEYPEKSNFFFIILIYIPHMWSATKKHTEWLKWECLYHWVLFCIVFTLLSLSCTCLSSWINIIESTETDLGNMISLIKNKEILILFKTFNWIEIKNSFSEISLIEFSVSDSGIPGIYIPGIPEIGFPGIILPGIPDIDIPGLPTSAEELEKILREWLDRLYIAGLISYYINLLLLLWLVVNWLKKLLKIWPEYVNIHLIPKTLRMAGRIYQCVVDIYDLTGSNLRKAYENSPGCWANTHIPLISLVYCIYDRAEIGNLERTMTRYTTSHYDWVLHGDHISVYFFAPSNWITLLIRHNSIFNITTGIGVYSCNIIPEPMNGVDFTNGSVCKLFGAERIYRWTLSACS